jgi:hypothetical protein
MNIYNILAEMEIQTEINLDNAHGKAEIHYREGQLNIIQEISERLKSKGNSLTIDENLLNYINKECAENCGIKWSIDNSPECDCPISRLYRAMIKLSKLEARKAYITEIIAKNLIGWDTSKDKEKGLLPEVYLSNKTIYKELTGKEYNFLEATKKYSF